MFKMPLTPSSLVTGNLTRVTSMRLRGDAISTTITGKGKCVIFFAFVCKIFTKLQNFEGEGIKFEVFWCFLRFVKSMSGRKSTYTVALNHLADFSDAEMKRMRGYRNTGIKSKFVYTSETSLDDIPDYMNWWLRGTREILVDMMLEMNSIVI